MICDLFYEQVLKHGGWLEPWPFHDGTGRYLAKHSLHLADPMDWRYKLALVWSVPLGVEQRRLQETFDRFREKIEAWYENPDPVPQALFAFADVSPDDLVF